MIDRVSTQDDAKRAAAEAAVAMVPDGALLGLGTGSTMAFAITALGRRCRDEGLRVACLPTSERTAQAAEAQGLKLIDFADCKQLDLCIDGADEVEIGSLALIKGLGGALLREKIVASNSARFIVVADGGKLVRRLGEKAPIPVEVVQFGHHTVERKLADMGVAPKMRLDAQGNPYLTDGGNLVYDCHGCTPIDNASLLDAQLRDLVGVVETGLFLNMASVALIAQAGTIRHLQPGDAP